MNGMATWLGIGASAAWGLLALLTAVSGVVMSGAITIHLAVSGLFALAAVLEACRVRALGSVQRAVGGEPGLRGLLKVEAVTSGGMLLVGALLLSAAAYRVFVEGMAVFG